LSHGILLNKGWGSRVCWKTPEAARPIMAKKGIEFHYSEFFNSASKCCAIKLHQSGVCTKKPSEMAW
jgi:hypothetical protein